MHFCSDTNEPPLLHVFLHTQELRMDVPHLHLKSVQGTIFPHVLQYKQHYLYLK